MQEYKRSAFSTSNCVAGLSIFSKFTSVNMYLSMEIMLTIEIDVRKKSINLLVSDEEISERLKKWKRPEPKFKKGWLGLYCKLASSGAEGGIMKYDNL